MSSEFSRCCIYEVRTHFLQEDSKDPELQRVLMSCSCVEFLESKASGAKVPWLAHEMAKPSSVPPRGMLLPGQIVKEVTASP